MTVKTMIEWQAPRRSESQMLKIVSTTNDPVFSNVLESEIENLSRRLEDRGYAPQLFIDRNKPELNGRYVMSIQK